MKGPASYFPSVEKHGVGHGHANALVAHTLQRDARGQP